MFWIAAMGLILAWLLIKFGVMSATVSFLALALKLAFVAALMAAGAAIWLKLRSRA